MTISAHYVSGTHWDREWYRPFQEYRVLLVKLLDRLIDLMERDPEFRYFQCDGQTCMLEDYLEVRPENRGRLKTLIQSGRILIGPWFTMPDLFCVGDEALIRNLLLGRRISQQWGVEPMPVGFICDMFGHPSQMPQIFAGFGYRDCVLGRGTNEHTTPPFFSWEAPDGSRVFTFKLQDAEGYGAFALPRATQEGEDMFFVSTMKAFCADLKEAGDDPKKQAEVRNKHFQLELVKYVGHEIQRGEGKPLCLLDSMDHIPPATEVRRYLELIREAFPNVSPRHSTLPMFFEQARCEAGELVVKRGELREPSRNKSNYLWLIPNCPSSRVRIKIANDACQTLMEKWADPLVALANLEGAEIPKRHLEIAWTHLLANHAHDSICGCSIDQVHRDMMYRYDQVRVLGEQLRAQAIGELTSNCADLAQSKDDFTIVVVNPLPQARNEVATFAVDLPLDYPAEFAESFFSVKLKAFILEDAQGNEIPYQRLAFIPKTNERSQFAKFCFQSDGEFTRYMVAAKLKMPALGFVSLRVKPSATPVRRAGSLRTGPASAQNESLSLQIEPNGTLTLTDKIRGETYRDLLTFVDRSEIGDGWFHVSSLNDEQILSTASSARVAIVHDGPEMVTFRVTITMMVGARYDRAAERQSGHLVPLTITSLISLRRDARVVDIETQVDNVAEDHRLRLLLPVDCPEAQTYVAHQPFDFVERRIALDSSTSVWQEMELSEKPFLGLQAVGAGSRGLAFLSAAGLHEGGVDDDLRRTMHVTLLRSYRKTVSTGGETDGLEKGTITYRYSLMPFGGELPRIEALHELARLQCGVITRQTGKRPSGYPEMQGNAKSTRQFIECRSRNLAVSAIKTPENGPGILLRLWNPHDDTRTEEIVFWRDVVNAETVLLNEEPDLNAAPPQIYGASVSIEAPAHRIVTLRVQFA